LLSFSSKGWQAITNGQSVGGNTLSMTHSDFHLLTYGDPYYFETTWAFGKIVTYNIPTVYNVGDGATINNFYYYYRNGGWAFTTKEAITSTVLTSNVPSTKSTVYNGAVWPNTSFTIPVASYESTYTAVPEWEESYSTNDSVAVPTTTLVTYTGYTYSDFNITIPATGLMSASVKLPPRPVLATFSSTVAGFFISSKDTQGTALQYPNAGDSKSTLSYSFTDKFNGGATKIGALSMLEETGYPYADVPFVVYGRFTSGWIKAQGSLGAQSIVGLVDATIPNITALYPYASLYPDCSIAIPYPTGEVTHYSTQATTVPTNSTQTRSTTTTFRRASVSFSSNGVTYSTSSTAMESGVSKVIGSSGVLSFQEKSEASVSRLNAFGYAGGGTKATFTIMAPQGMLFTACGTSSGLSRVASSTLFTTAGEKVTYYSWIADVFGPCAIAVSKYAP